MNAPRAPGVVARAAVELAVRPLPGLDDRLRYRAEFTADLVALPPLGRLRYAAGIVRHAFALRAALGADPARAEEAAVTAPGSSSPEPPSLRGGLVSTTSPPGPFWRCRVLRWHDFVVRSTSDGGRFQMCRRCGVDRGPVGYGPLTTPPWPVGSAGC